MCLVGGNLIFFLQSDCEKYHDSLNPNLDTGSTDCRSKLLSVSGKTMQTVVAQFFINIADISIARAQKWKLRE